MGTTADKLQNIIVAKQGIAGKIQSFGGTVPATLAEYPDAVFGTMADLLAGAIATIDSSEIEELGDYCCYARKRLVSVRLPEVTDIPQRAFYVCTALASVHFPKARTIGNYAFYGCSALTSLDFPALLELAGNAFQNCTSLAAFHAPELTTITGLNFGGTAIAELDLPKLATASNATFASMAALRTIRLYNVSTVPLRCFDGCSSLEVVDFRGRTLNTVPALANVSAFQNTPTTRKIVVPDSLYSAWIAAANWKSTTYNIRDSIVRASDYAEN